MGLPRSNLVKKSSEVVSPVASAPVAASAASIPPPPASILAPNPFASPNPFAVPSPFAAANPFAAAEVAPALTAPALTAPALTAEPAVDLAPARESYRTKADSVEVCVESQRAPETFREPPPVAFAAQHPQIAPSEPMRGQYSSSPSANELLERAAALGPARMTWESIVLPADPILHEKRTPHVAERRARLTRMVKIGLGACLGVCVLALGVSALSADSSSDSSSPHTAASESIGKTVPSKGIIPVEPLDGTRHAKAVRRVAPAVTTAAIVRTKRR